MSVNLIFLSTNVRCLFNKMDELLTFTRSCSEPQNELSVIAVQETWADTSDPDSLYAIPGYKLTRADRQDFGGGVALCTAESFKTRVLTIPMTAAECVWTRASTDNLSLVVANIYRPPRSDSTLFCAELERSIKTARAEGDNRLLLGDFNAKNMAHHRQNRSPWGRHTNSSTHIRPHPTCQIPYLHPPTNTSLMSRPCYILTPHQ